MLFNSVFFIIVFLPLSLIGWFLLQRLEKPVFAKIFLVGMSFWFYGYYNVSYLWILSFSMLMNFGFSILFDKVKRFGSRRVLLIVSVMGNLGLLFYFKYFNFFIDNCNYFFHTDITIERIALPLGISFFTFQQLSYIVDLYWKKTVHYKWWDYACYISFFPQLIAGPIVHHQDFCPQLLVRKNRRVKAENLFDGFALFILGLAKKVLLADTLAIVVNAEFNNIHALDAVAAWVTIICFTLELYFDFSGYCDMARGIGKMFGFNLPENFHSPLMATSVRDFWRRWHMTLTAFFTSYIYIPLGGNRKGTPRKLLNLMIVFAVSGLWHGANWTFVIWGLLNGLAIVWENLFPKLRFKLEWLNRVFTFGFTVMAFAIFRSNSLQDALLLFKKLFTGGWNGMLFGMSNVLLIPENYVIRQGLEVLLPSALNMMYLATLLLPMIIGVLLIRGKRAGEWIKEKGRSTIGLIVLASLFVWSFVSLSQVSTFLYFNF